MPAYPDNAVESPRRSTSCPGSSWLARWAFLEQAQVLGSSGSGGGGFFLINLVPVFGFIVMNYATMVWSMDHLVYLRSSA